MSRIIRTPAEAQKRLQEIEEAVVDYERAHGLVDDFHLDVLRSIASGKLRHQACQELAKVALKTEGIKFERYTA